MRRVRSRLLPPGVISASLILGACAQGGAEEEGIFVESVPAEIRDMAITAEATGELEPVRRIEVKSKASGEILKLFVDSGDEVQPGTLLASVDPRDVENGHDQATADLDVATARLGVAEAQLERSRQLLESDVITAQEFEGRQLEHANAQAALVRAETNLELAALRLTDVTIRAPMAGTVLEKMVEEGQVIQSATGNVSGGTTLFVMANLDEMRVRTLVDESDVGQLSAGLEATVEVEAFSDRSFTGNVEKIEPQAVTVQNVTMFPVIVLLDNRAGLLKPGMNADVTILVDERRGALTVPNNVVVSPSQVAPAAEVLGLDPQIAAVPPDAWRDLIAEASARLGVEAPAPATGGALSGIRERIQSGEISRDSAAAIFRNMRAAGGGQDGTPGRGQGGRGQGRGTPPAQGGATGRPAFTRAVVFVVSEDQLITPKPVLMGIADWDHAEIVAGLSEGEELAMIGAAQLQAQQEARMERMRSRFGGGRPFGG